ncbi:MAG: hypothetical protein CMJ83_03005 [Planctomycetes bacterium]|nr:hypothetical protein [Planctomycetota bacterium]
MYTHRSMRLGILTCGAIVALTAGCASPDSRAHVRPPVATAANGVFVRHLRVRVDPAHVKDFESLLKLCVATAKAGPRGTDRSDWLCYREPPGRYWLLSFSDTIDGFARPGRLPRFVQQLGSSKGPDAAAEMSRRLTGIPHEIEWEVVLQQKASWSTVGDMNTATHPKARMMERRIRSGHDAAFDRALAARTAFLADHGYPLPIEGFVTRRGDTERAFQVVFPRDWSAFHGTRSFAAFVRAMPPADQTRYARVKAALMATMSGAEWYDASFAPELSFKAE